MTSLALIVAIVSSLVGNVTALTTPAGTQNLAYAAANRISTAGYVYDANGSLMTDPIRHDPYGGARPGSTVGAGIGWTAEWRDPAGLVNLRARAYDPATARFVARDTYGGELGDPASANRYAFGAGSPLTTVDPSGHVVEHVLVEPRIAWSAALQSLPGVGDLYSFLAATLGFDPIGGFALTPEERAGALATAILPGPAAYALGRPAQKVAGAVRRTDNVADATRAADGAGDLSAGALADEGVWDGTPSPAAGQADVVAASTGKATDKVAWPPNRGFLHDPVPTTLKPGTIVDRYGREGGTFVSPRGTPFPQRALPPDSLDAPYSVYEVVSDLDVRGGITAPWFGQPGGGVQYELPASVADLISRGILKRVG